MNLVVIVESVQQLVTHAGGGLNGLHIPSLVAVGAALGLIVQYLFYALSNTCDYSRCKAAPVSVLLLITRQVKSGSSTMGGSSE